MLLASASVCAPNEPIPVPLLAAALPDEDVFAKAFSRLLRASLLTRRRGREQAGEPVEIHPLVADAALRLLAVPAEERAETLGNQLLGLVDTAGDILTHDRALADAMRQALHFALRLQSQTGVRLALRLGQFHSARGLYALARVADEQALALARRVLGERHPDTLTSMNNLAVTLRAQGDLAGARVLQEQVLAASRQLLGERHPDTLTMNNLALTLRAQGDLAGARVLQEQVLAASRQLLGERHPDTLTMNNLALTLRAQGDLAGARVLQEQVLAASRQLLGERHPDTTVSACNLFITLSHLNAAEEAKRVRDDHLVWLRNAAVESLDGQQRQIRDWLQFIWRVPMFLLSLSLRSRGRADSWLSRVAGWLRRRGGH